MSAKILLVGCGAIGGLFAATLSSVAKVTALDANAEHVEAIRARGLQVEESTRGANRSNLRSDRAERHKIRCRHLSDQI
jgi:ketopantoate reductase